MSEEVFPLESSKYKIKGLVGRGATASVYAATCLTNDVDVALKIIDLELCQIELSAFRSEISLWASLDDPCLVKYYTSFVEANLLYIVMEYMDIGSFHEILRYKYKEGIPKENIISSILRSTLEGLFYFHSHEEIHRDIKAGNILINRRGEVKLGDFGIAAKLIENGQRLRARFTVVGTPCYMAPEVIYAGVGYTEKADIWSLGITAIELATGSAPYSNLYPLEVIVKVTNSPPPVLPKNFSPEFRDFVASCLQQDPEKRPTAQDLLGHNFIVQASSQKRMIDFFADIPDVQEQYRIKHSKQKSSKKAKKSPEEKKRRFSWNFEEYNSQSSSAEKIADVNKEEVVNAPSESDIIGILKNKIFVMRERIDQIKSENRALNRQIDSLFLQASGLVKQ